MNVAPQIGTKYVLIGPLGTRVTFNDPADPDNVGVLTNISGTDSPEVREDGETFVQSDGGAHGPFLYGRRPIMLEGIVYGHVSDAQRNERVARLIQASDAMAGDATLSWQPAGGAAVFTKLRRQQPTKISGGWNKSFQLSMVAADPRFYGNTLNSVTRTTTADTTISNAGNADTYPAYTIWGPTTGLMDIKIDGTSVVLSNRALDLDRGFVIDSLNRTITGYRRRVNWFKNPSFEHASTSMVQTTPGDSSGFYGTGSPTVDAFAAQPTVSSGFGSKVLKMTASGAGVFPTPAVTGSEKISTFVLQSGQSGNPNVTGFKVPTYDLIRPTYMVVSFSYLRASAVPSTYVPYLLFGLIDHNNDPVIDPDITMQFTGTAFSDTAWQRMSVAFELPNLNVALPMICEIQIGAKNPAGSLVAGQIFYFDAIAVEFIQGSTSSAFFYPDGVTYGWEGTADNSRTYSFGADPLFPPMSNYELIDFAGSNWNPLPGGSHTLSMVGSFTTGGSLKVDWRDAWL